MLGSPPQVRGKPPEKLPESLIQRITPAGAGKTLNLNTSREEVTDHPRRCGENSFPVSLSVQSAGITPAGAGKTED